MILPFALALFWGALLLFFVEPMVAKMVVPVLGGTPSVWTICLVFFQGVLLAGYLYGHWITSRFRLKTQLMIHGVVLCLPLLVLPISLSHAGAPVGGANPSAWLLWVLILTVGLPFFVVSAGAPLIQKWFSQTPHRSSQDPYFLYAASNLGNMGALLLYPAFIEPRFRLATQSQLWTIGYSGLVFLTAFCGWFVWKNPPPPTEGPRAPSPALPRKQMALWLLYAFVPSSLMLGTTTFLTTDIASVPLLWILPLALYLLSFILVFSKLRLYPKRFFRFLMPAMILLVFLLTFIDTGPNIYLLVGIHLLTFFSVAMVCHGELAASRPPIENLTKFYLLLSLGGVLGGMFNALVAPFLFTTVLEYPLVMALACLFLPPFFRRPTTKNLGGDLLALAVISFLTWFLFFQSDYVARVLPVLSNDSLTLVEFFIPVVICGFFIFHPRRFRWSLVGFLLVLTVFTLSDENVLFRDRSFFGCLAVSKNETGNFMELTHGTTLHGRQSLNPKLRQTALTYYYPTGPIGEVFRKSPICQTALDLAVIGLGAGSLATYAKAGQKMTFYEIDKAVERVAENPKYFTFISDARKRGAFIETILGDARLKIAEAKDHLYSLIVVDAFSSDAIPIHLMTQEAVEIYLNKLTPDGILAFHISNRFVDLSPVLERLGKEAGLHVLYAQDSEAIENLKFTTSWVFLAREVVSFRGLKKRPGWELLKGNSRYPLWTDDFSNLLSLILAG